MNSVLWFFVVFTTVLNRHGQATNLTVNIAYIRNLNNYTFKCPLSHESSNTTWSYLHGPTGSATVQCENEKCKVSPSNSFLSNNRYSCTCNNTVHAVLLKGFDNTVDGNNVLACRDGLQPALGSTWIMKHGDCIDCNNNILFAIKEITEGGNVTFICRVSSDVPYVNWNKFGSNTAVMGVQNGQCSTQGITFLDNTSKYIYTCNRTVYQVTILNVQRSAHNDMFMCTPVNKTEGTGSNWIIKVKVSVTSVTLTPSTYLVNITENTSVQFKCTISKARPVASVYWYRHPNGNNGNETQITENITTTTDYNDFSVTTSILRFVPIRQDNDTKIYCSANNSVNTIPVRSNRSRLLNVLYKADDPYILQGSKHRVIENTPGTLACTVKGGNPTSTLSLSCNKFSPTNQTVINSNGNITTTLTWTPSRTHEGTCTCTSQQPAFQDVTRDMSLVVLYPPSKPTFRAGGSNVHGDIYFIEGNTRTIKCSADSKPLPDRYTWTGPTIASTVDIQSVTLNDITKMNAGEYTCSVHNNMNLSNGSFVAGVNSSAVNVTVLYPPSALYFMYDYQSGQNISNKSIDVIEGDSFNIVCQSIDGNPAPTIKWNGQNNTSSVLRVVNIKDSDTGATCNATNKMNETNKEVVQGNISDTIRFNILIRPVIKRCEFHYNNQPTNVIISNNDDIYALMVIENESFTLNCSTEGKPTPIVWWKIPHVPFEPSSSVSVNNLTRAMNGDYVFTANSLLEPSFKDKLNVTVNMTVSVQILYPPVVQPMNDTWKLKAKQLNVMCNYTAGLPGETTIKWTRDIDNREWNTTTLNIEPLEKSDTGIYICTASNIMIQNGDDQSYIGQHNQSFHLDVQYAAEITSFTINEYSNQTATINESDPVILSCDADSNPTALLVFNYENKMLKNATSNNLEYTIAQAKCLDAGTYYCSAKNEHNGENGVQGNVKLFVNYYPRKANVINGNITSEKYSSLNIVINVVAYPAPTFTWYQLVDGNWTSLHAGDNYVIESANLRSNLTIHSVGIEEFTNYKVVAENDFGQMEQNYTLSPYDKPDPPTRLRHIEGLTTTSSIHIEWKPGFDNGPSQTFYIKYKKRSDTVWNYRNVDDNGEPTMTITLTGLLENTQYDVVIFASNMKGNSTESDVLTTRTKATPILPSATGALIGGIAGGVTSCIVIVIIIIFIIRRYPMFKGNGAARQDIRRSVSDDSDDEDGLVDNPMYESSSNVARVASTSASTSTDIYSKPLKPNKTNVADNEDIYSVVNKIKGQGNGGTCKSTNGKDKQKEGNVYENFELDNDPRKADVGKQLPPEPPPTASKLKIVNQDGLIYADLVFKDKPHGEKMAILGDDPTPYDLVDFTKKAEPLPESDE